MPEYRYRRSGILVRALPTLRHSGARPTDTPDFSCEFTDAP